MRNAGDSTRHRLAEAFDLDHRTREAIATDNAEIAALCNIGIRLLARGVTLMADHELTPAEMVMGMAAAQISNSLRSAVTLAFGGYPVQSLAVTRLAAEYWLLFVYMRLRPAEAAGWQDFSRGSPKTAGELAKVVFADDTASSAVFYDLRQVLHRFAHQDNLGLAAVNKEAKGSTAVLQLGSDPDPHYLAAAAYALLLVMVLAADSISRAYGDRDPRWTNDVRRFGGLVIQWQDRVAQQEDARLRALGWLPEEERHG